MIGAFVELLVVGAAREIVERSPLSRHSAWVLRAACEIAFRSPCLIVAVGCA